jgi:hypothetical protein
MIKSEAQYILLLYWRNNQSLNVRIYRYPELATVAFVRSPLAGITSREAVLVYIGGETGMVTEVLG